MQIKISNPAIWIASEAVDFRKSINGLSGLIIHKEGKWPKEAVYVFYNRHQNRIKILGWHGNGFGLTYKCLNKGKFKLRRIGAQIKITPKQLSWLMAGLDWQAMSEWKGLPPADYF